MENTTITLKQSVIVAPVGKNGKVSLNNSKAADLLNSSSRATIVSAALTSHGAVQVLARNALKSSVPTLESMLSAPAIDGSQWGDLLTLLVGEFGVSCYSRTQHKGKAGCTAYLDAVLLDANAQFARAENAKQQARPMAVIEQGQIARDQVERLLAVAEQARIEADQQQEKQAA